MVCAVGRWLGGGARWFAARDCSFACSNREFEGFCAFAAAPLLVQIVCDVLKNGSTTMSQRVNPPYYGEPSGEFAQRSEQLLRIIDVGGEFLVGWRDEPSL